MKYDELGRDQKASIFEYWLNQVEESDVSDRDIINSWVDEIGAEADLNGRQIRNIVRVALALARDTKGDERLSKEHLKKFMQASKDFTRDLARPTKSMRDANEAGRTR